MSPASPPAKATRDLDVLWVTNMAAPYRLPVWQAIQKSARLKIALLESKDSLVADRNSNRGLDWIPLETSPLTFDEVPTMKLQRGEARYYLPRNLRSLMAVRGYDVLVFGGWESPIYWFLLIFAKIFRKGCVGFYESTLKTMKNRRGPIAWARQRFFSAMDTVVVPGGAAREAVLSFGYDPTRIFEGFNAVDVERFRKGHINRSSRGSGHAFLYAGQLIERKRVDSIISAFSNLRDDDDTLTIIGSGAEWIAALALSAPAVTLLPYIENARMPEVMAKHDTLVLASSEEVWGLVVNEALAAGMHVVVAENCGVVPSVQHMRGVFVTDHDLADLGGRMAQSRSSWNGRIANPEIMVHTPERFAEVFLAAITTATADDR